MIEQLYQGAIFAIPIQGLTSEPLLERRYESLRNSLTELFSAYGATAYVDVNEGNDSFTVHATHNGVQVLPAHPFQGVHTAPNPENLKNVTSNFKSVGNQLVSISNGSPTRTAVVTHGLIFTRLHNLRVEFTMPLMDVLHQMKRRVERMGELSGEILDTGRELAEARFPKNLSLQEMYDVIDI